MATDYRDDTLSADRYTVQTEETAPVTTPKRTPAAYTGTNVNHPRFPQYRKDMTSAQKRAHTRAGKPRKAQVAQVPAKVTVVVESRKASAKVAPALDNAAIVRLFAKPVPGLSKKVAATIAGLLATPANVSVAQWGVLAQVAAKPSTFDVLTLRAALGVKAPVKAARKAA
jgi:hypothetical protein